MILALIYWQISFVKYVPNHLLVYCIIFLYFSSLLFNNLKKNLFWKRTHTNSWFWTSTLHSNSVIIHRGKVLYVSNEKLTREEIQTASVDVLRSVYTFFQTKHFDEGCSEWFPPGQVDGKVYCGIQNLNS